MTEHKHTKNIRRSVKLSVLALATGSAVFLRGLIIVVALIVMLPIWFVVGGVYHIGKRESPLMLFEEVERVMNFILPNDRDEPRSPEQPLSPER